MATERKAPIAKKKENGKVEALSVVMMPIMSVRAYGKNPRVISEKAVAKVAASLNAFGWRQPIVVDSNNTIIVGHTRLMAAASLGLTEVPVHVAHNLTKAQANAYRLADNRTGEESRWDSEMLTFEIAGLSDMGFDLSLTGFTTEDLAIHALDGVWHSDIAARIERVTETDAGIPDKLIVTCDRADTANVREVLLQALIKYPSAKVS